MGFAVLLSLQETSILLQTAIGPAIVVSACGLLLVCMTNRLGRIVDRSRSLSQQRRGASGRNRKSLDGQLEILLRRAGLVRKAILFAGMCQVCTVALVVSMFALLASGVASAFIFLGSLFVASMACLLASLLYFMRDIYMSLQALESEVAASADDRIDG